MLFVSTKRGLRLIKKPTDVTMDENRRTQVIRGEKVEFIDGRYQTDKQDIIDWLIGNKEKGIPPHEELIRGRFTAVEEGDLNKMRSQAVQMVTGANSTINRETGRSDGPPLSQADEPNKPTIVELLAESEKRTDDKINAALSQIMEMLRPNTKQVEPSNVPIPEKAKKKFTCPICFKEFTTGFAIGKHKKEAHSDVYIHEGE